jgi:hypothetical protein
MALVVVILAEVGEVYEERSYSRAVLCTYMCNWLHPNQVNSAVSCRLCAAYLKAISTNLNLTTIVNLSLSIFKPIYHCLYE